jgi:hypothetical protein
MSSVNNTSRVLGAAFLLQAITSLISGLILKLALIVPGNISESMINIEKLLTNFPKYVFRDIQPPVVSGDMATHEYMVDVGLKDGRKGSVPSVVVAEFRNHRITQMRVYLDKLEAAKQLAKGLVAKRAVASVAKQVEALVNP